MQCIRRISRAYLKISLEKHQADHPDAEVHHQTQKDHLRNLGGPLPKSQNYQKEPIRPSPAAQNYNSHEQYLHLLLKLR